MLFASDRLLQRAATALLMLFTALGIAAEPDQDAGAPPAWNEAYAVQSELNPGLEEPPPPIDLVSPRATLDLFIGACENNDFGLAAHALNLHGIPEPRQMSAGKARAKELFYLISKRIWIQWDDIPDRPDAALQPPVTASGSVDPVPRRFIEIGQIEIGGHAVHIRLQRIQIGDGQPVWVFSRQTVDSIPRLYREHGPSRLHDLMPGPLQVGMAGDTYLWQWLLAVVALVVGAAAGWLAQKVSFWYLHSRKETTWSVRIATAIRRPVAGLCFFVVVYVLFSSTLDFPAAIHTTLTAVLATLIILNVTWLGIRVLNFGLEEAKSSYLGKREMSVEDEEDSAARQVVTYFTIARMVFIFIITFIGTGVILSQFRFFQALGISLLASAGAASVIVGFAAHRVLGNLIAGVQIAITQPVRIGDTVHFDGDWSYVEEINYTHLVLRTWDQRRIIIPLNYFMNHTIENWSTSKPSLTKPIMLHTDYRLDVEKLRTKYKELLEGSELWDESVPPTVQVYECQEETLQIRCLCSAQNAASAWVLHCELREKMVRWLQQLEDGKYLPRKRMLYYPHDDGGPPHDGEAGEPPDQDP